MGGLDGLEHHIVGHLVGAGLDHDHLLGGGDHGDVQVGDLTLLAVGIKDQLAVHKTHLQRAHRAVPGDIGDGESRGGADEARDLGRAVVVHAHDRGHDGHVVAEVGGEEGTDGPVDDAAGQDALLTGTAFPAVKGAGDAAHGVELLLEVHAQGEEIDAVPGTGGGGGAHQDPGVAVAHHDGGVGQLSQLAHFQGQGTARQFHLILTIIGELSLGNDS